MKKLFEAMLSFDEPKRPPWYTWHNDEDILRYKGDDKDYTNFYRSYGISPSSMPVNAHRPNGKLFRAPAALKIIAENPGSTKDEINEVMKSEFGYNSVNNELFAMLRSNDLFISKQGKYYATARGIGYLKSVGILNKDIEYPCVRNLIYDDNVGDKKFKAVSDVNKKADISTDDINFEDD